MLLLYTPKKFVILEYYCIRLLGEELKAKAPPEEKLESQAIYFLNLKTSRQLKRRETEQGGKEENGQRTLIGRHSLINILTMESCRDSLFFSFAVTSPIKNTIAQRVEFQHNSAKASEVTTLLTLTKGQEVKIKIKEKKLQRGTI